MSKFKPLIMVIVLNILIVLFTFIVMEFVVWATHKYVMHGFLWNLHMIITWLIKQDLSKRMITFLIFAIPSIILIYYGLAILYWFFYWFRYIYFMV